ncbi:MAG: serine/threonine-protein kinase [Desulfosarcinaceae bacterium]|nr:serine/threonine-protein kinase [Desulfosarcinaceae bacterium]
MDSGRQIDKYRIKRPLRKGGMASVYVAEHELLQKVMALKILPPEMGNDHAYVERFLREARAAASLDHPHIIRIHDVGRSDGLYYIAMDLIEGSTLKAVIREGAPLPTEEIVRVSQQVLTALSVAHAKQIIHRDLKPQNIMINRQGEVVVMDFGIAKALDDVDLTRTGMFIGTARYASPEQVKGAPVDPRSDLYSWALVMFEMATGRPPERFKAPKPEELSEIPTELRNVIAQGLAIAPEERFASAASMLAALPVPEAPQTRNATAPPLPPETLTALQIPSVQATVALPSTTVKPWYLRKLVLASMVTLVVLSAAVTGWWLAVLKPQPSPASQVDERPVTPVTMAASDLNVWADKPTYRVGENLRLYYRSTRDGYLFLFHQSADGSIQQIFPLSSTDDNFITAQLTYTIPDPSHNFDYLASPPVGQDRILAHMIADRDEAIAWQAEQADKPAPPAEMLTEKLVLTIEK